MCYDKQEIVMRAAFKAATFVQLWLPTAPPPASRQSAQFHVKIVVAFRYCWGIAKFIWC